MNYLKNRYFIRRGGKEKATFFTAPICDTSVSEQRTGHFGGFLFVSASHGRLTDRAIENLVKKYADAAGITKHITPHKCRSTFATNLYSETNDVYMIKDALHHKSLETSKHYINGALERKKKAAKVAGSLFTD